MKVKAKDKVNLTERFARNLKLFRTAAGLSQGDLAEKIGVSPPYVSQLETAVRSPSMDTVEECARALSVPAVKLLG